MNDFFYFHIFQQCATIENMNLTFVITVKIKCQEGHFFFLVVLLRRPLLLKAIGTMKLTVGGFLSNLGIAQGLDDVRD
jgi:hypothetical protein